MTQASASQATVGGDTDRLAVQSYSGGMVRHFKSNSGSKLESIDHTRPGDMWDKFQDRIIREALAGIPWPVELSLEGRERHRHNHQKHSSTRTRER